jgi:hypothetical protein
LKKHLTAAVLAALAVSSQAQVAAQGEPMTALTPFLGIGLTYGGDQIGEDIDYDNGSSRRLLGGSLLDLRAGLEFEAPGSPLSFQLSIGYHFDSATARNGDASFTRVPLEVLMHYRAAPNWRFGGGLRQALNAKSSSSGAGSVYVDDQKFKASVGVVLEGEVFFARSLGLKIRAVSEKYKPDTGSYSWNSSTKEIDGSHIGVIGVYYFK